MAQAAAVVTLHLHVAAKLPVAAVALPRHADVNLQLVAVQLNQHADVNLAAAACWENWANEIANQLVAVKLLAVTLDVLQALLVDVPSQFVAVKLPAVQLDATADVLLVVHLPADAKLLHVTADAAADRAVVVCCQSCSARSLA